MLVNISDVLSEQHKTVVADAELDMNEFRRDSDSYSIKTKDTVHIIVEHMEGTKLSVSGNTNLTITIPCDRCLEAVDQQFNLNLSKEIDLDEDHAKEDEELDEANFIEGHQLDVDQLIYNEILIAWPMKVLCSEDCKGICNICGKNLNQGQCSCEDTSLDPRMSVIQEIFKTQKSV